MINDWVNLSWLHTPQLVFWLGSGQLWMTTSLLFCSRSPIRSGMAQWTLLCVCLFYTQSSKEQILSPFISRTEGGVRKQKHRHIDNYLSIQYQGNFNNTRRQLNDKNPSFNSRPETTPKVTSMFSSKPFCKDFMYMWVPACKSV